MDALYYQCPCGAQAHHECPYNPYVFPVSVDPPRNYPPVSQTPFLAVSVGGLSTPGNGSAYYAPGNYSSVPSSSAIEVPCSQAEHTAVSQIVLETQTPSTGVTPRPSRQGTLDIRLPNPKVQHPMPHSASLRPPGDRLGCIQHKPLLGEWWSAHDSSSMLERALFTVADIRLLGLEKRRKIYEACLHAHITQLHDSLEALGCYPASDESLALYHGLSAGAAKVREVRCHYLGVPADELRQNTIIALHQAVEDMTIRLAKLQNRNAIIRAEFET
ncbi:hypothetical protein NM688_g4589 [Phlebia brevispora]|uniref:Uncharacterized protein n=1 Tax=Phlebia brevispora TaxID=194682 RepID=A0ACC1T2J7_9APHY|nr:hypothetical protein NM688_g4589 [Phlebia brevispora]